MRIARSCIAARIAEHADDGSHGWSGDTEGRWSDAALIRRLKKIRPDTEFFTIERFVRSSYFDDEERLHQTMSPVIHRSKRYYVVRAPNDPPRTLADAQELQLHPDLRTTIRVFEEQESQASE